MIEDGFTDGLFSNVLNLNNFPLLTFRLLLIDLRAELRDLFGNLGVALPLDVEDDASDDGDETDN
jgi:hypothetical protein